VEVLTAPSTGQVPDNILDKLGFSVPGFLILLALLVLLFVGYRIVRRKARHKHDSP